MIQYATVLTHHCATASLPLNVLQYTIVFAVYSSVLQYVVASDSIQPLRNSGAASQFGAVCCSALQYNVVCCGMLNQIQCCCCATAELPLSGVQYVAVCCSIL